MKILEIFQKFFKIFLHFSSFFGLITKHSKLWNMNLMRCVYLWCVYLWCVYLWCVYLWYVYLLYVYEWRSFKNDEFSRMTNFQEWQIFKNDEFSGMTNFWEWWIFGNDEFSGMTNFRKWRFFRTRDEFFWPSIFYPVRALGSEYLLSCFLMVFNKVNHSVPCQFSWLWVPSTEGSRLMLLLGPGKNSH